MAWDDAKKALAVELYKKEMAKLDSDEQKALATTEIVAEIAEELGETVNGTRMILQRAEVYIKKPAGTSSSAKVASAKAEGAKRVSKADAVQDLTNAISAIDPELVDEEILSKLTGKAAAYFASILLKVGN